MCEMSINFQFWNEKRRKNVKCVLFVIVLLRKNHFIFAILGSKKSIIQNDLYIWLTILK